MTAAARPQIPERSTPSDLRRKAIRDPVQTGNELAPGSKPGERRDRNPVPCLLSYVNKFDCERCLRLGGRLAVFQYRDSRVHGLVPRKMNWRTGTLCPIPNSRPSALLNPAHHKKLYGSISTWTRTAFGGRTDASQDCRRSCMRTDRVVRTSNLRRWRPRRSARGAGAGPNTLKSCA